MKRNIATRRRTSRRQVFRRILLGILSTPAILSAVPAYGQMTGGNVVAGQASITQDGSTLNVNALSDRTIINWQGFSIPAGETANFLQPGANSAVLNRVTTPNNPSAIYGALNSNGNVLLVNPSGIVVGPSGVINTNGFTASVLDIPDNEFLQGGSLTFRGSSTASVINEGTIHTGSGGAALIGGSVSNTGTITSNGGSISLATGGSVTLEDGSRFTHADLATIESGVSPYAGVIQNSGTLRATGALETGGEVYLVNPGGKVMQQGLIAATKQLEETNASVGGKVVVSGDTVELQGATIDASGIAGGGTINIGGGPQARDESIVNASNTTVDATSILQAHAIEDGDGGQVTIWSDDSTVFNGTATAGGGANGGDGGTVIVWGTKRVFFHGSIDTMGGKGGFVEVSTKGTGVIDGIAKTLNMLVDPGDVCIGDGSDCSGFPDATHVDFSTILPTLDAGGTFTLNTDTHGTENTGTGRVDFGGNANFIVNNNSGTIGTFIVHAADSIDTHNVQFQSNGTSGTNYELYAGSAATATPVATADITLNGQNFATGGGHAIFDAADDIFINDPLLTGGGNATLIARGGSGSSAITFGGGADGYVRTTDGAGNAGTVSIQADEIVVNTSANPIIDANGIGGIVTVAPMTNGRTIDLGTVTAGSLSLTDATIDKIAAEVLRLGSDSSGNISITAAITVDSANVATLDLRTSEAVLDNNIGTDITVDNLVFQTGGGFGTAGNRIGVAVNNLAFANTAGVVNLSNFNQDLTITALDGLAASSNTGTTTSIEILGSGELTFAVDASSSGNADFTATAIRVNEGVTVDASPAGTLAFNATTVNLDGDLNAVANGISGTATTVNVLGSAGGAQLQDAVDVAAAGATVNVSDGSYSGFTIDVENLTVDGVSTGAVVNAASPAITIAADGVTVQNLLLQGTGAAGEVGILLDGTAAPSLTGIEITGVDFSNLDDGIRSQGNIGSGALADVTIRGTDAANPIIFEDFLDSAIDVGDTDGNATYVVQDVIVRDGDSSGGATGGDGFRFGSVGGVTVQAVEISGATGDGIQLGSLDGAIVTILDSAISGGANGSSGTAADSGIRFGAISNGSTITISGNSAITSDSFHGLLFSGAISGATTAIDIANNTLIEGASQGIVLTASSSDARFEIRGNGTDASNGIRGSNDAITLNSGGAGVLTNMTFIIGGDIAADGNYIVSSTEAIDIEAIDGGRFVVANNKLLQGSTGIEFEQAIRNGAQILIVGNLEIAATGNSVEFEESVTDSTVTISGNGITSANSDALRFFANRAITDSTILIGSANVTVDGTPLAAGGNTLAAGGDGIDVSASVAGNTALTVSDNLVGTAAARVGGDGIAFRAGILDTATVAIGGTNQVFATDHAIEADDLQSSLSISGGNYDATNGALLVDNTSVAGSDGRLNIGAAAFVGGAGSTVIEGLTDTGNAGVDIDFSGAATVDGGAIGLYLSGLGIDILNDTLGSLAFSAQTDDYITLADGTEFLPGSPTMLDATSVSFDGLLGSLMSSAQLLAAEDMLTHFADDNTLGLIDIATQFVVQGESIQTAVNAAGLLAGPQTVTVGTGTFGGSVEVWVDNLSLIGTGTSTVIDTDAVDAFANNGDTNNGFQVAAISALSGGGDVSGVILDGFNFETLRSTGTNIGVELGENAAGSSTAINATVRNSTFNDLRDGFFSNLSNGITAITGNTLTGIGRRGINFADAVVAGENVVITNNNATSSDWTIVFDSTTTDATIQISGNTLASTAANDAIIFDGTISNSTVTIGGTTAAEANDISGYDDGIDVDTISGGTFSVTGNTRIVGNAASSGDGIEFDRFIQNGATVNIANNQQITGGHDGVSFLNTIQSDATVNIDENTSIVGTSRSAVRTASVNASNFNIHGNTTITGGMDAVEFNGTISNGSSVDITDNTEILGAQNGIEFVGEISSGASIEVSDNQAIVGARTGIAFEDTLTGSTATVSGNSSIAGEDYGISFESVREGSTLLIDNNSSIVGNLEAAINIQQVDESEVTVDANTNLGGGVDGIRLNALSGGSLIEIRDNAAIRGDTGDGILFDSSISDSAVTVQDNSAITAAVDGLEFNGSIAGTSSVLVDGNTVQAANGIYHGAGSSIMDDANVQYRDNQITVSSPSGAGIVIRNVNSSNPVTVEGGSLTDGAFGLQVHQTAGTELVGRVVLDAVTVNQATDSGLEFTNNNALDTLEVTLQNGVTVNGGASATDVGLVIQGAGISLSGDTLADTQFLGGNGNFVELRDEALFEPGQPTLIDGTGVNFAGLNAEVDADRQVIIGKIVDFLDAPTLGLIYPGGSFADLSQLTYDRFTRYSDYFRTVFVLLGTHQGTINAPTPKVEIVESLGE